MCGGTVFAGLHKGREALDKAIADFSREAKLLSAVGAEYLVHLPEQYTDMHTGEATQAADIDPEQWSNLITGTNELGKLIYEEYGVKLVFHPHADTHVDTQDRILQFLEDTDPQYVNLCLDTGHVAYCDGDNIEIIKQAPDRITYVHLKFVDPKVRQRVRDGEALARRGGAARASWSSRPTASRRCRRCSDALARARPRDLRHPRAGPVPSRTGHPAWHPGPRRRLPHGLRPRPDSPLALQSREGTITNGEDRPGSRRCTTPTCPSPTRCARPPTSGTSTWSSRRAPTSSSGTGIPRPTTRPSPRSRRRARKPGVTLLTLVPVFNWSSPDEQERQAQVRNWRRLLQIAAELECPVVNSELSGDPNDPVRSEHAFYKSMEELSPDFEKYGIGLNLEAHPYDFSETNDDAVQIIRGLNKPWVNYVFCAPHAFHLSAGRGRPAPDDASTPETS